MCQGQIVYIYHIFCKPALVLLCFQKNIDFCRPLLPSTDPPSSSLPPGPGPSHTQHKAVSFLSRLTRTRTSICPAPCLAPGRAHKRC